MPSRQLSYIILFDVTIPVNRAKFLQAVKEELPPIGSDDAALKQDLFAFLLENATDQIYFKDKEGRFLCVSRAVAVFMGVEKPADLIGKTDFDFWSEQTAREAADDEKRIIETGIP